MLLLGTHLLTEVQTFIYTLVSIVIMMQNKELRSALANYIWIATAKTSTFPSLGTIKRTIKRKAGNLVKAFKVIALKCSNMPRCAFGNVVTVVSVWLGIDSDHFLSFRMKEGIYHYYMG
jgi:hypothetical protein